MRGNLSAPGPDDDIDIGIYATSPSGNGVRGSKITAGIVRSCHKRPVSISQINNMVDEIETQIFNIGEKEISTKTIGEIVMSKLKAVDEVAYVRFASVYREFKDVDSFMEEIKKILK